MQHPRFKTTLLIAGLLIVSASQAHAYVGPGAGFAVMGSFFAVFSAILAGMLAVITWPIRYLIRLIRYRKAFRRSRIKRCVILGLDGMDPKLAEKMMDEGKLPTLNRLRKEGTFRPLATTVPSMSPVAWSSFQTGTNPGKHNIYDFLTRDKQTYLPKLSSVDIRGPRRIIQIGSLSLPVGKPDIRLLRKGKPFWITLGEHGIFSSVLRVPITFPPEKFYGVSLSGMCVPDLRGSQGTFSLFTTKSSGPMEVEGGQYYHVQRHGDRITADLTGPDDPFHADSDPLKIRFTVKIKGRESAVLNIGKEKAALRLNQYTEWVKVAFKAAPGVTVKGICKFLLQSAEPEFRLYVTPINIDPEKPTLPVTHPMVYATYLAKQQGPFATLGLAEDSWAHNEKALPDEEFIEQCLQLDKERETMFFDSLEKVSRGLCVCVFDGTDRLQHAFWRDIDPGHPAHDTSRKERNVIEDLYKRMDDLTARTLKKCDDGKTLFLIVSDHGFNTFRYGIDLNRWLEQEGYLAMKEGERGGKYLEGIDWSETKAFAIGLSGIFLNIRGRESQGIVEDGEEAARLRAEIAEKLEKLVDAERGKPAICKVYNALKIYDGPYKGNAPDLLVGYYPGYRVAWETATGKVTKQVFHPNTKSWSGDHCIDASFVPGVLFSNRKIENADPRLMDIGPTVLDLFGVDVPGNMDGRPLTVYL
jgi:predicted AlkP superfamily phosphohydrolase/phosphomutase